MRSLCILSKGDDWKRGEKYIVVERMMIEKTKFSWNFHMILTKYFLMLFALFFVICFWIVDTFLTISQKCMREIVVWYNFWYEHGRKRLYKKENCESFCYLETLILTSLIWRLAPEFPNVLSLWACA